ncbi:FAD-dependent oxidoreductase [Acuticoccus kandeliae]|uniref:FAD-dependent oxidoreductase n=1 Tax=Acuticoccus kandeliae TaxID=2073160 RepID=UPI00196B946C|nr:FAD-dependent oxidoreductase [Acuticoccus kandeliae]
MTGEATDVVVLGSGVGGLTAALVAARAGLSVIVLEHLDKIGGTSARSSGTVWIPANHYLAAAGVEGDAEAARTYLNALGGDRVDPAITDAFIKSAPVMLKELCDGEGLSFRPFMTAPDYRQDHPGAAPGGRALEPAPFDGRTLGADFARLAEPLPELMVFGGMMVTRSEAARLLTADRSAGAAALGARMVARYARDRLRHHRGTRLVLGNALVARLLRACRDRGVVVRTGVSAERLLTRGRAVTGVAGTANGAPFEIATSRAIILAGGGFPANPEWRAREMPQPTPKATPASPGADGSTLALAEAAGAALGPAGSDNAMWFPSSFATRPDGSTAVWPHIVLDRSKPGLIAVDGTGRRFTNEAVSYHEFVRAMYRAHEAGRAAVPAYLIADRAFIKRYGLGLIRPRTPRLAPYVARGYLIEAADIAALAGKIDVPAEILEATVARYNAFAADGVDRDFHKGETIYDRSNGDQAVAPNPCVGPIKTAPFYAVAVWPTPLGTSRGLAADTNARVLDAAGAPIPGLYACGGDMQSAFGGEYPGAGAQLGQAMTFAWLAARHAAGTNLSADTPADLPRNMTTDARGGAEWH